mmetsp:Transcript_19658/g.22778  ORF Transcript_19658/g.22778 Transcript_19658/m.22778 type:complete len:252 (-) Transcript_19658:153-908(-)
MPSFDEIDPEDGVGNIITDDKKSGRKQLAMIAEHTMIEIAAGSLATISVVISIVAMVLTSSFTMTCAGVLGLILGPYSYWQQRNITDIKALKETHEALVREVDHLTSENHRLKGLVEELGGTIDTLVDVENALDMVQNMNADSIESLKDQVQQSKGILVSMKQNLKAQALQNIITVVLNSDSDGDSVINGEEVDQLIFSLKGINGLEVNEQKFRDAISNKNGSVEAVVDILQDLVSGSSNPQEAGFFTVSN